FLSQILKGISVLYRLGVDLRNKAYDKGWRRIHSVQAPVVSVGNISVGGTGKTPLVQLLASELQNSGQVAILTRGFRAKKKKKKNLRIDSNTRLTAEECGDEPFLLSQTTQADIWIGSDRVLSAKAAQDAGASCLLLDDGFQHRRLFRDLEIVVIDSEDPVSSFRFLPYGFLRDHPKRLKKADLLVATHLRDLEHYAALQKLLSPYSKAPLVGMQREFMTSLTLEKRKIGVFCALARPSYFLSALQAAQANIIEAYILPDHRSPLEKQLQKFIASCKEKGATDIVCTEKDWVKLRLEDSPALQVHPLAIRLKVIAGKTHWDQTIATIKQRIEVYR
ncbi:MAG: tetraacyldisaccharide 4'-kinase, partial [Chlamydiales bacterium]|nr:tetraacyldisaccharide 4'-kinase [Chlamydiales bacterium]